ncbi:uncharacterized protein J8A68_005906 [[Candida] subhashii]|uniref:DUF3533 domain-containing protein n=1 Tax=[Candida] subhashii TaxID=561895 RepID=A0A8J5QLC6_9ASCO|nr:uncharacterized protein J8A68_005906 [[Candida] subhashii]KAG7660640.1 hypothetical protein J8A68_005906 [[Candida] subhashii]
MDSPSPTNTRIHQTHSGIDPHSNINPIQLSSSENSDDSPAAPLNYELGERMTGVRHAADAINKTNTAEDEPPLSQVKSNKSIYLTPMERFQEYVGVFPRFIQVYVTIFCIFLGILSIYWGSLYQRPSRFRNMKFLVVIEDVDSFPGTNGNMVDPLVGNTMRTMLETNETVLSLGNWDIVNLTQFTTLASSHNNTISQEVNHQVHHQNYWGAIHVLPNSTAQIFTSFAQADPTFMINGVNSTIQVVYESGRHFSALNQYVFRHLDLVGETWIRTYVTPQIYSPILQSLNQSQHQAILSSNSTIAMLNSFPAFSYLDLRPPRSAAVLGPSELGLIYAQLFSFHQFNFSFEIYSFMRSKLRFKQFIIYRCILSQINSLILSLVYSLMTIAFQVPVNVAFGRSGFLVLWMFMYLFMSASAGINENVVNVIFTYDRKEFIAPWMILNIVMNISTTFAPFVLMPGVFRYGYALPMFNTYENLKVVFFDTWKGTLGRNIGVLVAWIVVMNVLLVFNNRWSYKRSKRVEHEKKAAAQSKEQEEKTGMKQDDSKGSKNTNEPSSESSSA